MAPGDCPSGFSFYRCSQGPFNGCCKSDPCTTGICPPEDMPAHEPEPSTEPSTTDSPSPSSSSPPSESPVESGTMTTTNSPSNSPTAPQIMTMTTSTIDLAPTPTIDPSYDETAAPNIGPAPSTSSGGKVGMIGGIAGGLISLLVGLLAILLLVRRRRRRARNKKINAGKDRDLADLYAGTSEKKAPDTPSTSTDRSSFRNSQGFYKKISGPSQFLAGARTSQHPANRATRTSNAALKTKPPPARPSIPRGPRPDSGLNGLIPLDTVAENSNSRRASIANSSVKPLPSLPPQLEPATEVPYPTELPGSPGPPPDLPDALRSPISTTSIMSTCRSPLTITTHEGALLQSNFDNRIDTPGTSQSHAMSFMNYRQELE